MKRLLGIISSDNTEKLLVSSGTFTGLVDLSQKTDFKYYDWLRDRDYVYTDSNITSEEVFNFRLGPLAGANQECSIYHLKTYGERMLAVNIDQTYKSRKIENLMVGRSFDEAIPLAESVCSNFAFSHSVAFTQAIEEALGIELSGYSKLLRVIFLEIERIYNHIYVIVKLSISAAQKVYSSHLLYLFERCISLNSKYFNSTFLKKIKRVGEVKDFPKELFLNYLEELKKVVNEFKKIYNFSLDSRNYLDRLHNTGILTIEDFYNIGFDGPALKAMNYSLDIREFSKTTKNFKPILEEEGDSLARMIVRAKEVSQSLEIIEESIELLQETQPESPKSLKTSQKRDSGIGQSESASGSITYYVEIKDQKIDYVYISTPSTFLFRAIQKALVGQIFTDFPFTVDSFGAFFCDCAR
ncbi:Ni,Fe-hydrogenase III large subunit [Thermodesulfobium sp. 4217-1]|uniref:hydrogenase large subunit n=1 Tax=Thermodesulfobium sp. 4217-1 TaxID=3120013 RepID=UPI0032214CD4